MKERKRGKTPKNQAPPRRNEDKIAYGWLPCSETKCSRYDWVGDFGNDGKYYCWECIDRHGGRKHLRPNQDNTCIEIED